MTKELLKNSKRIFNTKKIYGLVLLVFTITSHAQVTPDNKKPAPVFNATRQPNAVKDIREKLVELALQNPTYEVIDRQVTIAAYNIKKAKGSWLSPIGVQGNLNEFAFKGSTTGTNGVVTNPSTFYPKYNIGATINFDMFSAKKNDVKIAKENFSIAQAQKNQRFREIKAEVLTKYEDYLLCQERLDFQSQITQDARTAYLAAEKDFQEGAIKQEDYNKSYRGYTDERLRQLEYQRNYNVIKLELEKMIGVSMDDLQKK